MLWALAARRAAAGDGVALLERGGERGVEEVRHTRRTSGGSDAGRFCGSGPGRGLLAAARAVGAAVAAREDELRPAGLERNEGGGMATREHVSMAQAQEEAPARGDLSTPWFGERSEAEPEAPKAEIAPSAAPVAAEAAA